MDESQFDLSSLPDVEQSERGLKPPVAAADPSKFATEEITEVKFDLSSLPDAYTPQERRQMADFDKISAAGPEAQADPAKYLQEQKLGNEMDYFIQHPEIYGQIWNEPQQKFQPIPWQVQLIKEGKWGVGTEIGTLPPTWEARQEAARQEELKKLHAEGATDAQLRVHYYGKTFYDALARVFRKDPGEGDQQIAEVLALSQHFNVSPIMVGENYDFYKTIATGKSSLLDDKLSQITAIGGFGFAGVATMGATWPEAAAGIAHIVGYGAAIAAEEQVNRAIRSHLEGTSFDQTRPYGLWDFVNDDEASKFTRATIDTIDIYAKYKALYAAGSPVLGWAWDKIAYRTLAKMGVQSFWVDTSLMPEDVMQALRQSGAVSDADLADASKYGWRVEVPTYSVIRMDSSLWAKIKSFLGGSPYFEMRTAVIGPAKVGVAEPQLAAPVGPEVSYPEGAAAPVGGLVGGESPTMLAEPTPGRESYVAGLRASGLNAAAIASQLAIWDKRARAWAQEKGSTPDEYYSQFAPGAAPPETILGKEPQVIPKREGLSQTDPRVQTAEHPIIQTGRQIGGMAEDLGVIPKGTTETILGPARAPQSDPRVARTPETKTQVLESDGTLKGPVGYKPPEGRDLDQETELVVRAMAQVESGDRPGVSEKAAGGLGRGRFQFDGGATGGTWVRYSKEYADANGIVGSVAFNDENQEKVARFKVRGWLEQGYSPKQIAATWNSGSADWAGKVGRNRRTGVEYNTPHHVEKFADAYAKLSGQPLPEASARTAFADTVRGNMGIPPDKGEEIIQEMDLRAQRWAERERLDPEEYYRRYFQESDAPVVGETVVAKHLMDAMAEDDHLLFQSQRGTSEDATLREPTAKYGEDEFKPPKKTITAYKLFDTKISKPGEIFPTMVGKGTSTALGEWIPAQVLSDQAKKQGLAPRPGWHAAPLPHAPQLQKGKKGEKRVWAEVELPADTEWQAKADASDTGDIRGEIPHGGHYVWTRPPSQGGKWLIGGAIRVKRVLSQKEIEKILSDAGVSDEFEPYGGGLSTDSDFIAQSINVEYVGRDPESGINTATGLITRSTGAGRDVEIIYPTRDFSRFGTDIYDEASFKRLQQIIDAVPRKQRKKVLSLSLGGNKLEQQPLINLSAGCSRCAAIMGAVDMGVLPPELARDILSCHGACYKNFDSGALSGASPWSTLIGKARRGQEGAAEKLQEYARRLGVVLSPEDITGKKTKAGKKAADSPILAQMKRAFADLPIEEKRKIFRELDAKDYLRSWQPQEAQTPVIAHPDDIAPFIRNISDKKWNEIVLNSKSPFIRGNQQGDWLVEVAAGAWQAYAGAMLERGIGDKVLSAVTAAWYADIPDEILTDIAGKYGDRLLLQVTGPIDFIPEEARLRLLGYHKLRRAGLNPVLRLITDEFGIGGRFLNDPKSVMMTVDYILDTKMKPSDILETPLHFDAPGMQITNPTPKNLHSMATRVKELFEMPDSESEHLALNNLQRNVIFFQEDPTALIHKIGHAQVGLTYDRLKELGIPNEKLDALRRAGFTYMFDRQGKMTEGVFVSRCCTTGKCISCDPMCMARVAREAMDTGGAIPESVGERMEKYGPTTAAAVVSQVRKGGQSPWELTRDEFKQYLSFYKAGLGLFGDFEIAVQNAGKDNITVEFKKTSGIKNAEVPSNIKDPHRFLVEQALREGKMVPVEAVEDYPDLKQWELYIDGYRGQVFKTKAEAEAEGQRMLKARETDKSLGGRTYEVIGKAKRLPPLPEPETPYEKPRIISTDTTTPEFKDWFKKSRVTPDEKRGGKPLTVFHGLWNYKEFAKTGAFDPDKLGDTTKSESAKKAFFFAGGKGTSVEYAGMEGIEPPFRVWGSLPGSMNELLGDLRYVLFHNKQQGNIAPKEIWDWYGDLVEEVFAAKTGMQRYKILQHYTEYAENKKLVYQLEDLMSDYYPVEEMRDFEQELWTDSGMKGKVPKKWTPEYGAWKEDHENEIYDYLSELASEKFSPWLNLIGGGTNLPDYEIHKRMYEWDKGFEPEQFKILPVYLRMENPLIHDFKMGKTILKDRDRTFVSLIDQALKEGRDGVIFKNVTDGGGFDNIYAVFDPIQIKSVENVGTWGQADPDIFRESSVDIGDPPDYLRREGALSPSDTEGLLEKSRAVVGTAPSVISQIEQGKELVRKPGSLPTKTDLRKPAVRKAFNQIVKRLGGVPLDRQDAASRVLYTQWLDEEQEAAYYRAIALWNKYKGNAEAIELALNREDEIKSAPSGGEDDPYVEGTKAYRRQLEARGQVPIPYTAHRGAGGTAGSEPQDPVRKEILTTFGHAFVARLERGPVDVIGQEVNSYAELADLAQIWRNPQYEEFRYVFVKDGIVVDHEGVTCRLPGSTKAFLSDYPRGIAHLKERILLTGADSVYLVHNHPSGEPSPSSADVKLTVQLSQMIPEIRGHVVINSGTYATITYDYAAKGSFIQVKELEGLPPDWVDPLLTPSVPHKALGHTIENGDEAAQWSKALTSERGRPVLFYLSPRNHIRGLQEVHIEHVDAWSDLNSKIFDQLINFGATKAILSLPISFVTGDIWRTACEFVRQGIYVDIIFHDSTGKDHSVQAYEGGKETDLMGGRDVDMMAKQRAEWIREQNEEYGKKLEDIKTGSGDHAVTQLQGMVQTAARKAGDPIYGLNREYDRAMFESPRSPREEYGKIPPMARKSGKGDITTVQTPQPEGGTPQIFSTLKPGDSFYNPDFGKGYRFFSDTGGRWAHFNLNGKLVAKGERLNAPSDTELNHWIEKAKNLNGSWLNDIPNNIFLRFGDLPKGGVSKDWSSGRVEKGVSVYSAKKDFVNNSIWFGENSLPGAALIRASEDAPVYLVTGKKVGIGTDGEPVLKNVEILHKLKFNSDSAPGFSPFNPSSSPEEGEHSILREKSVPYGGKPSDPYDAVQAEAARRASSIIKETETKTRKRVEAEARKEANEVLAKLPQFKTAERLRTEGLRLDSLSDFPPETLSKLRKRYPGMVRTDAGLDVMDAAAETGSPSAEALINTLISLPTKPAFVQNYINREMERREPEIALTALERQAIFVGQEQNVLAEEVPPSEFPEGIRPEGTTGEWKDSITAPGIKSVVEDRTGVKVSDLTVGKEYDNFKAAIKLAAKNARIAYRAGRKDEAIKQKARQKELIDYLLSRMSERVDMQKTIKKINAIAGRKSTFGARITLPDGTKKNIQATLPIDYRKQVAGILKSVGWPKFDKVSILDPENLADFLRRKEQTEGVVWESDFDGLTSLFGKEFKNLTQDGLHNILECLQELIHNAKEEGFVVAGNNRYRLEDIVSHMTQRIRQMHKLDPRTGDPKAAVPHDIPESKIRRMQLMLRNWNISILEVETLAQWLDGVTDKMGPNWLHLYEPMNKAVQSLHLMEKDLNRMYDLLKPFRKGMGGLSEWASKKYNFPELGGLYLTKLQIMGLAKHFGNPGNREAAKAAIKVPDATGASKPLTDEQLWAVVSALTPEEWRILLDIMAIRNNPTRRRQLADAYLENTGNEFPFLDLAPVTIPHLGEVPGWHAMMIDDPEASYEMEQRYAQNESRDLLARQYRPKSPRSGFVIARREGAKHILDLDFISTEARTIMDTIRYIALTTAGKNTQKVINHPAFRQAVEERVGKEYHRMLLPWLQDELRPQSDKLAAPVAFLAKMRRNAVLVHIGLKFWTVIRHVPQVLMIAEATEEKYLMNALFNPQYGVLARPLACRDFIESKSEYMAAHVLKAGDRDIAELVLNFDPQESEWRHWVNKLSMIGIETIIGALSRAGWLSEYFRWLEKTGSEEEALRYADKIVRDSVGSYDPKDLSEMRRAGELKRMLTAFGTVPAALYQRFFLMFAKLSAGGGAGGTGGPGGPGGTGTGGPPPGGGPQWEPGEEKSSPQKAAEFLRSFLYIVIGMGLLDKMTGERKWIHSVKEAVLGLIEHMASVVPLFKDILRLSIRATLGPSQGHFEVTPAAEFGQDIVELSQMAAQGKLGTRRGFERSMSLLGFLGKGYPTDQVATTIEGFYDLAAGTPGRGPLNILVKPPAKPQGKGESRMSIK